MSVEHVEGSFDLYSPRFAADPHGTYAELRSQCPVYHAEYPGGLRLWLVTRYEDAIAVLSDTRFSMNSDNSSSPLFHSEPEPAQRGLDRNLTNLDPPEHTKLRRYVTREFSAARVEALRPRVRAHVDHLIDAIAPKGSADLVAEFAAPLPTGVAGELLAVSPEDWERFRVLSNRLVSPDYDMGPDDFDENKRRIRAFIGELVESKRREPGDDLTSSLIRVCDEEGAIVEDELVGILFTLLVGSHETTSNFIATAMLALLQNPDQLALLREKPQLTASAVEELLRFDGPFQVSSLRFAREDVRLGDATIAKGDTVVAVIAAANRDAERFTDPDRLDITRTPNPHLAFGNGIHFCPGRTLSLLEAEVALHRLVTRLPDLRLGSATPIPWREGLFFRGPRQLPIEFTPSPARV